MTPLVLKNAYKNRFFDIFPLPNFVFKRTVSLLDQIRYIKHDFPVKTVLSAYFWKATGGVVQLKTF